MQNCFVFNNVLDSQSCDLISEYVVNNVNKSFKDLNKPPWDEKDNIPLAHVNDKEIKQFIKMFRFHVGVLAMQSFNIVLYPEFTDLVLWRTGRSMASHIDNGYGNNSELQKRVVSTVTYLNDNFKGGETFVKDDENKIFVNKPIKGSMICFYSDEKSWHGVNLVESGNRITLPIWFTDDPKAQEDLKY